MIPVARRRLHDLLPSQISQSNPTALSVKSTLASVARRLFSLVGGGQTQGQKLNQEQVQILEQGQGQIHDQKLELNSKAVDGRRDAANTAASLSTTSAIISISTMASSVDLPVDVSASAAAAAVKKDTAKEGSDKEDVAKMALTISRDGTVTTNTNTVTNTPHLRGGGEVSAAAVAVAVVAAVVDKSPVTTKATTRTTISTTV